MLIPLIERWERAFDEIGLLSQYRSAAKTFKYAKVPCFDLKNYTKKKFPPGRRLVDTAVEDPVSSFEYGLDESGRPCYTSFYSQGGKSEWQGYYTYQEHLVEYVEFNIQTRTPSCIKRVLFEDSRKIAFQHISIDGGASVPAFIGLPKEEIISRIKNHKFFIQAQIEQYEYDHDKIVKAECLGTGFGQGEYKFLQLYSYDQAGNLDEIRDFYSNGSSRLSYARPAKKQGVRELSDRLAGLIAESVVDTLLKNKVESPVAIVQLGYQYVYTYLPLVISRPESLRQEILAEGGDNIWEDLFLGFDEFMSLDKTKFERPFEQFMQLIKETEDYKMGTTMLRKAAALLTKNKLMGKIPVGDEFFAFVIDHSVEGHSKEEFVKILQECGMDESIINAWDKRGWLRPE